MSSKLDDSGDYGEYEDDFEVMSDEEAAAAPVPAPAPVPVQSTPAAAAASGGGTAPSHTTQLFAGHSDAQEWEDVPFKDVELGKKLGGGGFAVVYEGVWKGEKVALKTLVRRRECPCLAPHRPDVDARPPVRPLRG